MTTDSEMKIDYMMLLKHLGSELATIDDRRSALEATIAGLERLASTEGEQPDLTGLDIPERGPARHNGKPVVPAGFFQGKTPTQAYRDFKKLWPGDYRPPQIADAFQDGGIEAESRTQLIQAIHSVLQRERKKQEREKAKKKR